MQGGGGGVRNNGHKMKAPPEMGNFFKIKSVVSISSGGAWFSLDIIC